MEVGEAYNVISQQSQTDSKWQSLHQKTSLEEANIVRHAANTRKGMLEKSGICYRDVGSNWNRTKPILYEDVQPQERMSPEPHNQENSSRLLETGIL